MKMKWITGLAALFTALICSADIDFSVSDRGKLTVKQNGRTVLDSGVLRLLDAVGGAVSLPLGGAPLLTEEEGAVNCSWAGDSGVVTRVVRKLDHPQGVEIIWSIKLLDGFREGRNMELAYRMPAAMFDYPDAGRRAIDSSRDKLEVTSGEGALKFSFSGCKTDWQFMDLRRDENHKHYRLQLVWPYNPADVNISEYRIRITE